MLDILVGIVKSQAQKLIVENQEVPNQYNEQAIGETAQSIMGGISNLLNGGDLSAILGLAKGDQSPDIKNITSDLQNRLARSCGVSSSAASAIAAAIIPMVMKAFATKLSDPNDSQVTPSSLLGMLGSSNNKGTPLAQMLEKFSGQNSVGDSSVFTALEGLFGKQATETTGS